MDSARISYWHPDSDPLYRCRDTSHGYPVFSLCTSLTRKRIEAVIGTIIGTVLPVSLWVVRNYQAGENAVNRILVWHWPAADKIHEGLMNLSGFFLPEFGGFVENS